MGEQLHFVLVPFMAQGHMIPMTDLGLLLAARGVRVSLITTPVNARRLRASTDRAAAGVLPLPLRLVELPFPCSAAGLPEGCENIDLVPRPELFPPFCKAPNLLVEPLKQYLRRYPPAPTCIIADQCMPWTMTVAKDLRIPRLVFHGPSCFYLLCIHNIFKHKAYDTVAGDLAAFPVPELPERIEVNRLQAQKFFNSPEMEDIQRHVDEAEKVADGFVLNTFYELEPWYIDAYSKAVGKKVL
ncbi:UDP-glycosyltransferase 73D1 [Apostasia shenzhenica]|uniref:UDP-glycosyltransferase 73D1 n=1 Tax=Apostasia shenzhenica TaxID=1088818 RepID=A0A2I0B9W1_9ASPA|nr:UDP-glycosyltransferase 73D1 [Apostasia shenzhenica]